MHVSLFNITNDNLWRFPRFLQQIISVMDNNASSPPGMIIMTRISCSKAGVSWLHPLIVAGFCYHTVQIQV